MSHYAIEILICQSLFLGLLLSQLGIPLCTPLFLVRILYSHSARRASPLPRLLAAFQ